MEMDSIGCPYPYVGDNCDIIYGTYRKNTVNGVLICLIVAYIFCLTKIGIIMVRLILQGFNFSPTTAMILLVFGGLFCNLIALTNPEGLLFEPPHSYLRRGTADLGMSGLFGCVIISMYETVRTYQQWMKGIYRLPKLLTAVSMIIGLIIAFGILSPIISGWYCLHAAFEWGYTSFVIATIPFSMANYALMILICTGSIICYYGVMISSVDDRILELEHILRKKKLVWMITLLCVSIQMWLRVREWIKQTAEKEPKFQLYELDHIFVGTCVSLFTQLVIGYRGIRTPMHHLYNSKLIGPMTDGQSNAISFFICLQLVGNFLIPSFFLPSVASMREFLLHWMFFSVTAFTLWEMNNCISDPGYIEDWTTSGILNKMTQTDGARKPKLIWINMRFYCKGMITMICNITILLALVSSSATPWKDEIFKYVDVQYLVAPLLTYLLDNPNLALDIQNVTFILQTVYVVNVLGMIVAVLTSNYRRLLRLRASARQTDKLKNRRNTFSSHFMSNASIITDGFFTWIEALENYFEWWSTFQSAFDFLLYVPFSVFVMKLILNGIDCHYLNILDDIYKTDKLVSIDPANCEYKNKHRFIVEITFFVMTFAVTIPMVRYSSFTMFLSYPALTVWPRSSIMWVFFRITMVYITELQNLSGLSLIIINFIIALISTTAEYHFPSICGKNRLNALQIALLGFTVTVFVGAFLSFGFPNQWFPVIFTAFAAPLTGIGTYFLALRRKYLADHGNFIHASAYRIKGFILRVTSEADFRAMFISNEGSSNSSDEDNMSRISLDLNNSMSERDLGIALYTNTFFSFLVSKLVTTGKKTISKKKKNKKNKQNLKKQ